MGSSRSRRQCPKCQSFQTVFNGTTETGKQKYFCKSCRRYGSFDLERASRDHTPRRRAELPVCLNDM